MNNMKKLMNIASENNHFTFLSEDNLEYIENLYRDYLQNKSSIAQEWQSFFENFELDKNQKSSQFSVISNDEFSVTELITAYRKRGHLIANINPFSFNRRKFNPHLDIENFGFNQADLNREFEAASIIGFKKTNLSNIISHLKKIYCQGIGFEFDYCSDNAIKQWISQKIESEKVNFTLSKQEKKKNLLLLNKAVNFEHFLQIKYAGKKRFSLEGLEILIPALDHLINKADDNEAKEYVLGMAHRGRLNVLTNIFQKKYEEIFSEFEDAGLPTHVDGDGDVKYHLGQSADIVLDSGKEIHLSLAFNPSHLEAVDPVVAGISYAKRIEIHNDDYKKVVPIVIHGDAALSGQGVIYETVNFSELDGFANGGTIHIVLNNQVGFTANNKETRSSLYCTDIAKVIEAPVFHVNADRPEEVIYAVQLATEFRQKFLKDVFIDIIGYRRYGHNEGDEPRFTQPLLYQHIKQHPNVYQIYSKQLLNQKVVTQKELDEVTNSIQTKLQKNLTDVKKRKKHILKIDFLKRYWSGLRVATKKDFKNSINTGVSRKKLDLIAKDIFKIPSEIELFDKMKKIIQNRNDNYFNQKLIDWGMAEMLSYGQLLKEGTNIRLSGQDSQRGTFSHRHSVIKDIKTEKKYVILDAIKEKKGTFCCYNSHLSEYGVLGFEYGYSITRPQSLNIWEAQFGDFSNGAQIMIDQFISSSESKWQRMSGLVLYLPHGYEGQGPEHSSARLERYLQLCAEYNMYVVNLTTPANFFHVIRRQIKNEFRKPLIVMTPKSILRNPQSYSSLNEIDEKTCFKEIISDTNLSDLPKNKIIQQVVFCSGKIYYDLKNAKEKNKKQTVSIVRIEQLYPFPFSQIEKLISVYKKHNSLIKFFWLQEEPANMGAWFFILRIIRMMKNIDINVISRSESASPATGNMKKHLSQQNQIIEEFLSL